MGSGQQTKASGHLTSFLTGDGALQMMTSLNYLTPFHDIDY